MANVAQLAVAKFGLAVAAPLLWAKISTRKRKVRFGTGSVPTVTSRSLPLHSITLSARPSSESGTVAERLSGLDSRSIRSWWTAGHRQAA
jgi:hypothetical protein